MILRYVTLFAVLALFAQVLSCGTPGAGEEIAPAEAPIGLLIEQEISGEILNQPLRSPYGLSVGEENEVYCVDRGNNRLIKFNRDLTPIRDAGGAGSAAGLLNRPGYVAVDNQLNVYVADEGNQRIVRFNSNLLFVDAVEFYDPEEPLRFGEPSGVGVNIHGEMWVADRQRNQIAVYTTTGAFDRFIADFGYQGGQVKSPQEIRVDRNGQYHVCDAGNGRVVVYDQYGSVVRTIANSAFDRPVSTAPLPGASWILDGEGRVFFCDLDGAILFVAGPLIPGSDTPLREPSDIVLLPNGRLLIADTGNNRLLVCRAISGSG